MSDYDDGFKPIEESDDGFKPIPAPSGDMAPVLTRIPSPPLPGGRKTSREYGTGETALMYGARGAAGRWPEKAAAAITATTGSGPEETWGERYDAAMQSTTDRYEDAAAQNPKTAGLLEVGGAALTGVATGGMGAGRSVGTILAKEGGKAALKEVGKRAAVNAAVSAAQAASYGNGAADTAEKAVSGGGVGGALSAAADAVARPGASRLFQWLAAGARRLPLIANTATSLHTAVDPNATPAEKVGAWAQLGMPLAAKLARAPEGKRTQYEQNYDSALGSVERNVADEARTQRWADEDISLKERRNAEDRAYFEQAAAERENMKRDDLTRGIDYATEDVAAQDAAHQRRVEQHQNRLTDKQRQVALAQKRAQQEALQNQWAQKQHQYKQEDIQTRAGRAMEDYDLQTKRAAADQARRDARLAIFDAETDFGRQMREHEKAKAQYDADVEAYKAGQKTRSDALKSAERLGDEKQRLIDSWKKDEAALLGDVPSMDEALASARGEYGQFHGEMLTRLANYLFGARETGQKPDPELVDVLARLVSKREELTKDGKLAKIVNMLDQQEGWINERAQQIVSEAQANADGSIANRKTPDFDKQAAENIANRNKLTPAAREMLESEWRKAGADPTGKSDDELRLGWDADPAPVAPQAPDHTLLEDAARAQRRSEMSLPAVPHTLGAERRLEDANKAATRLGERGAPVAKDAASEALTQRQIELGRLQQQNAPGYTGKAYRSLEKKQNALARLDSEGDNTPFRFDRRDEDLARARQRASESATDPVPTAADKTEAQQRVQEAKAELLERQRIARKKLFPDNDLVGEYVRMKLSPAERLMSSKIGHLLRGKDSDSLAEYLALKSGHKNRSEFADPAAAAAINRDMAEFGGDLVPRAYQAGRGLQSAASGISLRDWLMGKRKKKEEEEEQSR